MSCLAIWTHYFISTSFNILSVDMNKEKVNDNRFENILTNIRYDIIKNNDCIVKIVEVLIYGSNKTKPCTYAKMNCLK